MDIFVAFGGCRHSDCGKQQEDASIDNSHSTLKRKASPGVAGHLTADSSIALHLKDLKLFIGNGFYSPATSLRQPACIVVGIRLFARRGPKPT